MSFLEDREHHFHALAASTSDLDNYVLRLRSVTGPNTIIRVVRGRRMQSKELLLDEFAAALQFPLYFGGNWDAFEECMSDLQWLPAKEYVLIIADAGSLLKIEPEGSIIVAFEILDRVSREWAAGRLPDIDVEREPVVFHTLLQDETPKIGELRRVLLPIVGDIPEVSRDKN